MVLQKIQISSVKNTSKPKPLNPEMDFVFSSKTRKIEATGIFGQIEDPSKDNILQWRRNRQNSLKKAQESGIHNPLVIGALSFSPDSASHLYIPKSSKILNKPTVPVTSLIPARLHDHNVSSHSSPEKRAYEATVSKAISRIKSNQIQKVVLSRQCVINLDTDLDIISVRQKMIRQNPEATHFCLSLPDGSTFLGASPELLVCRNGARVTCKPLAGSAHRHENPAEDQRRSEALRVSEKDRHEHAIVVEQICNVLSSFCNEITCPKEPDLVATPQMWHLATQIEGVLVDRSLTALDLALALHPTAAVCGYPTAEAQKVITDLEPFDRGFFGGAVGWCNLQGDGEWVVAIRCAVVRERSLQLYAGAGIVADSDPASEWAETNAKLETMRSVFNIRSGGS